MHTKMSDFAQSVFARLCQMDKEKQIQIFPHANVDGDCIGSACALALGLRRLGYATTVVLECEIPQRLAFMKVDPSLYTVFQEDMLEKMQSVQGIAFAVDCSEGHRMGKVEALFDQGKEKMVIDHHVSVVSDLENAYVDAKSASASELVYQFLREMESLYGAEILDGTIADFLMVGIQSDSGKFSFESTRPVTLRIAADLMELGANVADNAYHLFDETSKGKVLLHGRALSGMELYDNGKIAISKVTNKMIEETGAPEGASDGVVNILRDIDTVLVAFVVRETDTEEIRVSCRSKEGFDCAAFAMTMGGGGHKRAAGFRSKMLTIDAFAEEIIAKATAFLEKS